MTITRPAQNDLWDDADHSPEKTELALRAAQMYYLQDLTMDAIARELITSRSTVSRLLSFARETGVVDIRVRQPRDRIVALEAEIQRRYGAVAHIVPVPTSATDVDRLERVAMSAARILAGFVHSNMVVGLGWGSTTNAVSRHLVTTPLSNSAIVQLNGAGNVFTSGVEYASEIFRRFAKAWDADVHLLPVPAFFDDPDTRAAMWRERSTKRLMQIHNQMDLVLFGVGSPFAAVPSHVYVAGYLDATDYASLSADRVVGDVASIFYRLDGSTEGIELNARSSGPSLDRLRKVGRRVCVVAGTSKVAAVRGALAAGVVTDLIVDEGLAQVLVSPAP